MVDKKPKNHCITIPASTWLALKTKADDNDRSIPKQLEHDYVTDA